jgi:hypothetical protein
VKRLIEGDRYCFTDAVTEGDSSVASAQVMAPIISWRWHNAGAVGQRFHGGSAGGQAARHPSGQVFVIGLPHRRQ